jgi:hypothetical protein
MRCRGGSRRDRVVSSPSRYALAALVATLAVGCRTPTKHEASATAAAPVDGVAACSDRPTSAPLDLLTAGKLRPVDAEQLFDFAQAVAAVDAPTPASTSQDPHLPPLPSGYHHADEAKPDADAWPAFYPRPSEWPSIADLRADLALPGSLANPTLLVGARQLQLKRVRKARLDLDDSDLLWGKDDKDRKDGAGTRCVAAQNARDRARLTTLAALLAQEIARLTPIAAAARARITDPAAFRKANLADVIANAAARRAAPPRQATPAGAGVGR